jgi:hypothetical protein
MKKTLLVSILLIPLMLIPIAFAGEPHPPSGEGERLVGPVIDGVLGIINNAGGGIDVTFSGICNGQSFGATIPSYLPSINLGLIVADNLVGWRVNVVQFPTIAAICNSKPGLEFVIVDWKKFEKSSGQAVAEVTLMFVEAK